MSMPLIRPTASGLYCEPGDFHIDPWRPVPRAVITHAHADHARSGSGLYVAARAGVPILARRLGRGAPLLGVREGQRFRMGRTWVSLHPAGHILGSTQVRVEYGSRVWVCSGDYKRDPDPTCAPFEVVPCETFITEATFALPVYRWPPGRQVAEEVAAWVDDNRHAGRTSLLFCYALGKAQRLLAELTPWLTEPVYLHGAMVPLVEAYREAGVALPATLPLSTLGPRTDPTGGLVLAPPSAANGPWMRRFRNPSTAFASGWMRVRGHRRRRAHDRGFVLSDHADWPALLQTIADTGARRVLVTHGRSDILVRYLQDVQGVRAAPLRTAFAADGEGDVDDRR